MKHISGNSNHFMGEKLRAKRKEQRMTQKELATMIGVTFQQLQKYESGKSKISIDMLIRICVAIDVEFDYFLANSSFQFEELSASHQLKEPSAKLEEVQNTQRAKNIGSSTPKGEDAELLEARLLKLFRSINDRKLRIILIEIAELMTEV